MRYKRYKSRRRYKSRAIKMKFQSFVDLSTEADKMKIISVNAGGNDVIKRLAPFFSAYKYYLLGNVSIKLIPASTLPVDPTGLSYELGENTVDPRDQLTPGMCRITNGEDILENITGLTGDQQRDLYNNMLLDPRWFKWMLQSGVKRTGSPRYWQIGQLHQDKWPGHVVNYPYVAQAGLGLLGTAVQDRELQEVSGVNVSTDLKASSPLGFFQTGHRGKLGWLPTDGLSQLIRKSGDSTEKFQMPFLASIPEIELFKILMPPVHKTNFFYRMFITETVYFKEPIVMNVNGYRPLDVFHRQDPANPALPNIGVNPITDANFDRQTGGNDGGN